LPLESRALTVFNVTAPAIQLTSARQPRQIKGIRKEIVMCTWNREILNGLEMPQGRGMPHEFGMPHGFGMPHEFGMPHGFEMPHE
jgi:hypothetical protein